MRINIIAGILLFATFGTTQDVDLDDVPRVCQQACQDITRLSDDCDRNNDDDAAERDCVCNADSAQQQASNCAACVKANVRNGNGDGDADDDLSDLFRACGWNYADVTPSSSDTASSTQSNNGTSSTSSVITTTQTFPATTTTVTSSGTTTIETIPATTVTSTRPASPSETEDSGNTGSSLTAGFAFVAAGLMAALPVVL
ncbi:hypothetical protein F4803DRAFT_532181 [Xylaria telfairii]|nr:hypothetical protein F4803DRAFT_532181 [Xylaria telfairii]